MKQTVQEVAQEMCEAWGMEDNHGYGVKETFEVGFCQGVQWATNHQWRMIKDELPPISNGWNSEECVKVLAVFSDKRIYGPRLCIFNSFHLWEYGLSMYDCYKVSDKDLWMPIPSFNYKDYE
jgi:hypothetical protein